MPDTPETPVPYVLLEYKVNNNAEGLKELRAQMKELTDAIQRRDDALEAREAERTRTEKQQLWNGIKTLITIIGALVGLIWAYRAIIIGSPPGN